MDIPEIEEPPDNPEPEEIPKKLGHRALRAKENKSSNEFVIKCSLNNGLKINDSFFRESFLTSINKRVEQISKMAHRMSIAVNILIRECIEKADDYSNVDMPLFLSEKGTGATFLYQLATETSNATKPDPHVSYFL